MTALVSASAAPKASAPRTWRLVSITLTTRNGTITSQESWRAAKTRSASLTPA